MQSPIHDLWTPPAAAPQQAGEIADDVLFYRQAEGLSVDALNDATHDVRGKGVERVLDTFIMPLVYAHKLREARQYSMLENPMTVEELVRNLGALPVVFMSGPVTAKVVDVAPHQGRGVAVYLDHPELFEEQRDLTMAVAEKLELPTPREVGPSERYAKILTGKLPRRGQTAQLDRIRKGLSGEVNVSAVKTPETDND